MILLIFNQSALMIEFLMSGKHFVKVLMFEHGSQYYQNFDWSPSAYTLCALRLIDLNLRMMAFFHKRNFYQNWHQRMFWYFELFIHYINHLFTIYEVTYSPLKHIFALLYHLLLMHNIFKPLSFISFGLVETPKT